MSIKNTQIKVYDMTCNSCEARIEKALMKLSGVRKVKASYVHSLVDVEYDSDLCSVSLMKEAIKLAGYSVEKSKYMKYIGIVIIALAAIYLSTYTGGFDINSKLKGATYFILFVVGILTSIHCVGMCGGIMLSQSMRSGTDDKQSKFEAIKPALLYNIGRVIAYTILGGIVGAIGSVFSLSLTTKSALQIIAGIFMVIMGLNMAGFSVFRRFHIRMPWSSCHVKRNAKTPFVVGLLNGLMPCGPLQTMQLYALGTGSAMKGALSMMVFGLGTIPLMLIFGAVSGFLSKGYTKQILKFSGILVVILGLIMGNRGLSLSGYNVPRLATDFVQKQLGIQSTTANAQVIKPEMENGTQIIRMTADDKGYTPNVLFVQKGVPVKWIINGTSLNSCNGQIVVPKLSVQKNLQSGENVIEFTPTDGDISFSCWMGMINGVIKVVDNINAVSAKDANTTVATSSGMPCCKGGPAPGASGASQKPSIYGNDLSKVPTNRLVKKADISGDVQKATLKGIGYEFDPLIVVVKANVKTSLTFDLINFDSPEGELKIVDGETGDTLASLQSKKGVNDINVTFKKAGAYVILKDGQISSLIDVVDNLSSANLDEIRAQYLQQ